MSAVVPAIEQILPIGRLPMVEIIDDSPKRTRIRLSRRFRRRIYYTRQPIEWCREQMMTIDGISDGRSSMWRQIRRGFGWWTVRTEVRGDSFDIFMGSQASYYWVPLSNMIGRGRMREIETGTCIELWLEVNPVSIGLVTIGGLMAAVGVLANLLRGPSGFWQELLPRESSSLFIAFPLFLVVCLGGSLYELWEDPYRDFVVRGLRSNEVKECVAPSPDQ